MSFWRTVCLTVLTACFLTTFTVRSAESITVKPAAFDRIEAKVPQEVMAGEEFEVQVTFMDRFGNTMPEGWKPEAPVSLTVSKPASVLPPLLTPDNYMPGFRFRVSTEKMGGLTIFLKDSAGEVLQQWELNISSGRPVKLLADIPSRAEVGQTVTLTFQAVDMHGNVAYGYSPESSSLTVENPALRVAGSVRSLGKGNFEIPVELRSAGEHAVSIKDRRKNLSGDAGVVAIVPAALDSFEISAGPKVTAGERLPVTIKAMDRYGNLVADYDARYKGVRLYSDGGDIAPDLVTPASFDGGVAQIQIEMRASGDYSIQVSEIQSNISGKLNLTVVAGQVEKVLVKTPDSAVAGEPFEITLEAQDRFGNIADVPTGKAVYLESTGTVPLRPDRVDGALFTGGTAKVKVVYEKAESFEIRASIRAGSAGAALAPAPDPRKKEKAAAERAREDAVQARREARLREKRSSEKTPEPAPALKPAVPAKPAPAPKPAVPAKPLRPGVLDGLEVKEIKDSAQVVFSTNGMTDYNVTTSAKLSRKWIDIEFPDINPELPERIAGGENIVGEVYVEELGNDRGVKISIEILPVRIGYDVYQEGNSIVLKITRQ
ncbi:MAG: hypothetical protein P1S46_05890 [bacterium]|nr:hypothetical protein [bacterium]